jgi:hypothetical protein
VRRHVGATGFAAGWLLIDLIGFFAVYDAT